MTDRRDPPADPRPAFRVVSTVKPDGRMIHYYEWPGRPAEAAEPEPAKKAPVEPGSTARRRV